MNRDVSLEFWKDTVHYTHIDFAGAGMGNIRLLGLDI